MIPSRVVLGTTQWRGGRGQDTLTGGTGKDVFIFNISSPLGNDLITDFVQGNDLLQMSGLIYDDLSFRATGSGVRIEWADGSIKLDDVAKSLITAKPIFGAVDRNDHPLGILLRNTLSGNAVI